MESLTTCNGLCAAQTARLSNAGAEIPAGMRENAIGTQVLKAAINVHRELGQERHLVRSLSCSQALPCLSAACLARLPAARLPLCEWTGRMTLCACGLQAEGSWLSKSPTGNSEEPWSAAQLFHFVPFVRSCGKSQSRF